MRVQSVESPKSFLFTSASGSPTIRRTFFSALSCSTTEAPNLMVSAKKLRYVDYFCARELVFELGNTSLVDFVFGRGSVVSRILSEMWIVGDGVLNSLHSLGPNALVAFIF
jgi:hypothetical protein